METLEKLLPADRFSKDPGDLQTYGRDWTKVHTPAPSMIAFPRSTEEVSKILAFCNKNKISVVPSGGRTGLAGGCVAANGEVVLSLSKMNKMGDVDAMARTLHVQAGAITEAIHKHCEPHGLTWPIDFGSKGSSQAGGNISTNAGGVRVIRYGLTRNWVLGLKVVTADGTIHDLNGALEKNNTGLDLRQLFIGSEGTLGVITEATLKLAPLPRDPQVFYFSLPSIVGVLNFFEAVRKEPFTVNAFECLSENCITSVRDKLGINPPITEVPAYGVLLEIETPERDDAAEALSKWLESLFESGLVQDGVMASSPEQAREIWKMRESITESLAARGLTHKHDIALPIADLNEFLAEFDEETDTDKIPGGKGIGCYVFGHIGDGNLHVSFLKPSEMDKDAFLKVCQTLDERMFKLIHKHHGSVSAEHGIGLLKKTLLQYSRTPEEIALMRAVKKVLDPNGILNPGKIL